MLIEMVPEVKLIRVKQRFYNAPWMMNLHGFGPVFLVLLAVLLLCAGTIIGLIITAG